MHHPFTNVLVFSKHLEMLCSEKLLAAVYLVLFCCARQDERTRKTTKMWDTRNPACRLAGFSSVDQLVYWRTKMIVKYSTSYCKLALKQSRESIAHIIHLSALNEWLRDMKTSNTLYPSIHPSHDSHPIPIIQTRRLPRPIEYPIGPLLHPSANASAWLVKKNFTSYI